MNRDTPQELGALENRQCTRCGMAKQKWSVEGGYTDVTGLSYCCQGCAENTGCVCVKVPVGENIDDWN